MTVDNKKMTVSIEDNGKVSSENIEKVPGIVEAIRNKTLRDLENEGCFVIPNSLKNSEDLGEEQFILQSIFQGGKEELFTGNVMGFLGKDKDKEGRPINERLIIHSRFSQSRSLDKDFFLWYMLWKVFGVAPPNLVNFKTDTSTNDEVLDLLCLVFPYYLKEAMKKGVYRTYVERECNDPKVKGTIDIARHIALNTPFVGNIAYKRTEFSSDNYLTELIRHTIEHIRRKPFGGDLLSQVKPEVASIVESTPRYNQAEKGYWINRNKQKIARHAFYKEYLTLQKLCLKILQNRKNAFDESHDKIYGILFDGSWLWEECVNKLIGDHFYHPKNRTGEGVQYLFEKNEEKICPIYPDFIGRDKEIIADAKYKPKGNIQINDYYQVLAYMFRFNSKHGFFLYPEAADGDETLTLGTGHTYKKGPAKSTKPRVEKITKLGLVIPKKNKKKSSFDDFNDFRNEMKSREDNFSGSLEDLAGLKQK